MRCVCLLHQGNGESLHLQWWVQRTAARCYSFKNHQEATKTLIIIIFFILACNFICHKKCLNKVETHCSKRCTEQVGTSIFSVQILKAHTSVSSCPSVFHVYPTYLVWQNGSLSGPHYFGVQVSALISDTNSVPKVMEMLLLHVELNGLYTEGIYRKSGSACRAKELQQVLDTGKKKSPHKLNLKYTIVYLSETQVQSESVLK